MKTKSVSISLAIFFVIFGLAITGGVLTHAKSVVTEEINAVIDPATAFVIYEQWDGSKSTIWIFDGKNKTYLFDGYMPSLSHNGRYLAYKKGDPDPSDADLYVRDLQSGTEEVIFNTYDYLGYYAWNADDTRIIFDHSCRIYSINHDGSDQQTVIDKWPSSGIDYCYNDWPDVNPVDNRVIWENYKYGLGIADSDGSNPAWIPNTQPDDYDARWSNDGQWILFYRDDNAYKIKPDGTDLTQLTNLSGDDNNYMDWVGGWANDDQDLVGAGKVNGTYGIYSYPSSGTGILTLLLTDSSIEEYFIGDIGSLPQVVFTPSLFLPLIAK